MILLIDNYDSFVFNLARYFEELGQKVVVFRNDKITIQQITQKIKPSHIVLSPGPCTPDESGVCLELIKELGNSFPILGICLGHQAIGQVFGAVVGRAQHPLHGASTPIFHEGDDLFLGLPNPFQAARYHSLIINKKVFPNDNLKTIASSKENEIMAVKHLSLPIYGVQFHPESIITPNGKSILKNFLTLTSAVIENRVVVDA